MATPVLQFKRGQQSNVGLASFQAGEPGFVTDEYNFYIGVDGSAANQQFFGSSRYWKKETVSTGGGVNLVSAHSVGSAGTSITLSAPASVGSPITYYFPATDGVSSSALITDGSGNLSWSNSFSDSIFSGITTFVQGLYYDVGNFDGPNGIAYFNNSGKLIGAASTESAISQSYYILTTEEVSGVPVWTSTIDGGQF